MNNKVLSSALSITVILFIVLLNFLFMRLTHEAIFPTISNHPFTHDAIKDISSVLDDKRVKESVKCILQITISIE
jgi:type IV secretory pathway VirB6-like protein